MQYQTESDQTDDATIVQAFAVYTLVTGLTYPNICSGKFCCSVFRTFRCHCRPPRFYFSKLGNRCRTHACRAFCIVTVIIAHRGIPDIFVICLEKLIEHQRSPHPRRRLVLVAKCLFRATRINKRNVHTPVVIASSISEMRGPACFFTE